MNSWLTWLAILACLSQSATMSGLNLAVFSISRLRLETAAGIGDADAIRVLALRRDANYTLATILWANVAVNVLLALLADSVLVGVAAFLFSTVVITVVGEIMPQAYFSRNALRVASRLAPLLRLYRGLLWPVARPIGLLLDAWIGPWGVNWLPEKELREVLRYHATNAGTEVSGLEATGAINFLALDDLPVGVEGEELDPRSIIRLRFDRDVPVLPVFACDAEDPFLRTLEASGKKWVVIVDATETPRLVVDAHAFLRDALFGGDSFSPLAHTHRPQVVVDARVPLGLVMGRLAVRPEHKCDDVVDEDIILLWTDSEKRIITGSDILGRLLHGIARRDSDGASSSLDTNKATKP
jgi:metal transporter CNNM